MKRRQTERALLLLILLAAAFFRLWRLDSVPPGLTHDEANNVHDAAAVLDGVRPFYFPVAQGKEPLYPYSVAALMAVLGRSPWVMRLTSALWGLFTVAMTYAWTRRAFDRPTAMLTAAGMAVGFWPVSVARMGLRAVALPALLAASAYFTWCGLGMVGPAQGAPKRRRYLPFFLAGGALGLSMYTYLAGRLVPAVPLLFCFYLLFFQRDLWRKVRGGILLMLLVSALVVIPLLLYLRAHPAAEIRLGQLDRPLQTLLDGDPSLLLDRVSEAAGMLSFYGDTFIPYNIPGKPVLGPTMSALFYVGLVLGLVRWRKPPYAFAVVWLVVGLGPALATGLEASNLRAIAALPVVFLFPALALREGGHLLTGLSSQAPRQRRFTEYALCFGAVVLFSLVAVQAFRDYFVRWAEDRDVRVHYHVDLLAVAETAEQLTGERIAVSSLYPGQYHDPRVVEAVMGVEADTIRWFDGRTSLVFPSGGPAMFIFPSTVSLNPALEPLASMTTVDRIAVKETDLTPWLDLYRGEAGELEQIGQEAQVGEVLFFLGSRLSSQRCVPGDTPELVTVWQVVGQLPNDRDAVIFAQLLDSEGQVVAQQDRLDVPSWDWHLDDQFAQLLRLSLPADVQPGRYRLIAGVYTVPDRVDAVLAGHEPDPAMPRLSVSLDGKPAGDTIELPPVEVVADAG